MAGSVWGLGVGVGTSVSAVACWRAPAPPVAVLRLQDELRQVFVQEEEADRSDGDAPPRGLHEVGSGEADGLLNESEVRTWHRWVEDANDVRWVEEAPGVRRLCACARPAVLCAKRARCFGEEGCPRARGARSRRWGGGGRPRTGTPSFKIGCKPPPAMAADGETITRDAFRLTEI